MRTHRGLAGLALALLVTVGGCAKAAADPGPGPGATGATYAADDLVVQVKEVGGFIAPAALLTRLPIVSVYGDGRVITVGPQIDIYPGPALPNILVQQISRADVARLAAMARAAGVGSSVNAGQPPIADAPTTTFTVRTATGLFTTNVIALGESDGTGLTPTERAVRGRLRLLLSQLDNLPGTLGAGAVSKAVPYEPTRLTAIARSFDMNTPSGPKQPEMAWPGPTLPGQPINASLDLHCVVVTGDPLTPVLDAAAKANRATPWRSAGRQWTLDFRPLLPDERDCADLGPA